MCAFVVSTGAGVRHAERHCAGPLDHDPQNYNDRRHDQRPFQECLHALPRIHEFRTVGAVYEGVNKFRDGALNPLIWGAIKGFSAPSPNCCAICSHLRSAA